MSRPTHPLRFAGGPTRDWRARHRRVALVFRRPRRPDPAAPPPTVRAGDQIAVTLAPRFTVLLQQFLAAVVVTGPERPAADGRQGASGPSGGPGRSPVAHHHYRSPAGPWPVRSTTMPVQHSTAAQLLARRATTAPPSPVDPPSACWSGPNTGVPSPFFDRPRLSATWPPDTMLAPSRSRPGQTRTGELTTGRSRGSLEHAGSRHLRHVIRDLPTREWTLIRDVGSSHAPPAQHAQPRVELALGAAARQGMRRAPRVAPVATVFRQQSSTQAATTARPSIPAPDAPVVRPPFDIDHLDRELWRRFEKRVRTERERRGRA